MSPLPITWTETKTSWWWRWWWWWWWWRSSWGSLIYSVLFLRVRVLLGVVASKIRKISHDSFMFMHIWQQLSIFCPYFDIVWLLCFTKVHLDVKIYKTCTELAFSGLAMRPLPGECTIAPRFMQPWFAWSSLARDLQYHRLWNGPWSNLDIEQGGEVFGWSSDSMVGSWENPWWPHFWKGRLRRYELIDGEIDGVPYSTLFFFHCLAVNIYIHIYIHINTYLYIHTYKYSYRYTWI